MAATTASRGVRASPSPNATPALTSVTVAAGVAMARMRSLWPTQSPAKGTPRRRTHALRRPEEGGRAGRRRRRREEAS
eukprot:scaffold15846_cov87-Isochrysis_galbana.AAC.5